MEFLKKYAEIQNYLKARPSTLISSFSSLTSLIQIFSFLSSNILLKNKKVLFLWVTAEFLHYFSPSRFGMNQFLAIGDWLSEISHRQRRALIGQIDLREKWMDLWLSHPFSVSENKKWNFREFRENLDKKGPAEVMPKVAPSNDALRRKFSAVTNTQDTGINF